MKVRATNPSPEENPGGCATCGVGVPPPPAVAGGGTPLQIWDWAMSQVGRPVGNPGYAPATNPEGHGMARKFKPSSARWADARPGTHPGRFGNPPGQQQAHVAGQALTTQSRAWSGRRRMRNGCDAGVGLALSATQAPAGPIQQANPCFGLHVHGDQVVPVIQQLQGNPGSPRGVAKLGFTLPSPSGAHASRAMGLYNPAPPLPSGRGGQLDYANQYAVFGPGVQPYRGYGGTGYAPQAPGVPVAYPVAPPGVYMQGQGCYSATDCAPGEYCHDGMCFPTPGEGRSVGTTKTTSIAGVPVGNPGSPMTQMTQSLAPPGFSVR